MLPKQQIVGLPVYQPGKPIELVKKEFNLTEVIKLASNENPFGPSPKVQQAILEESTLLSYYPDGGSYELRHALAEHYQLKSEQFIFGNGSDEAIQLINRAYLQKGTNTIMATPTFPIYKTNATIEGAEVIEVPLLENGKHNLDRMREHINSDTRVVWVCNPNNPSGTYSSEDEVLAFIREVPEHVLIVLDEAYYEYVTAEDFPNSVPYLEQFPNVIILRTFSKIYGLAALRIGYGIASETIIDTLNRVRPPFNNSRMAQKAAVAALADQAYIQQCAERNRLGLEQYYRACEQLGYEYYPSQGNFILINMKQMGNEVFNHLLKQGIIVRSGEALGFPTYIRVTIGTEEQNNRVIQAISHLVVKGAS